MYKYVPRLKSKTYRKRSTAMMRHKINTYHRYPLSNITLAVEFFGRACVKGF